MHVPDGYLSPIFSIGIGVLIVPTWARAVTKVRSVLNNRTIPLLVNLAAFSFTVMMFNVPVPGGTTAHGVAGTLIAVVLGPWAAVICVSTALIIQALFFGDGGVLAIFTNCLNMGIILPFVGYYSYKLIAGLITGGGRIDHLFSADWSQVSWPDVGTMLLIVAGIGIVLIPLAWFLLPRPIKRPGTLFVTIAVIAPLGLIAPGFAFGEGKPDYLKSAFGYIPQGLQQLNGIWAAPFGGYNVNANFFNDPNAPLWHAALGYEISGIIGILLIGAVVLGIGWLLRRMSPKSVEEPAVSADSPAEGSA